MVALCWTLSSFPMSLWNWGSKDGTQRSRCGLKTRAGDVIASPNLLATLLATQPKAQFALVTVRVHRDLRILSDGGGKDHHRGVEALRKACRLVSVYLGVAGN